MKAAIAFGGIDKAMEYVNPPRPKAPEGFKDRSVDTDAGMIAKAFAPKPEIVVDKAESTDESITHAGLKIYPIKVKIGDKVEQRWGVQTLNNAEREKNGERQLGGDPLSDTLDGAKKLAEQEVEGAKRKIGRAHV